ncbi:5-(carboxyamino)imidazole ribonucleotide synthase [Putridiphycobacter roseus]|uniref:N5-carboxyaminoimidazole ribonucleotide synthase n=1 Tax=Putridiphycobacter roseus TaxID=2219161 RepID=A0A2W1NAR7_9FLAO|nr:5-(carboxyamino)imidazole ribonucleotide synthase [Putridiphycobacter roseus]PZE16133.1 5-(carboxyamino)imidazole ribonucleotide synthase [Putridiphycobacter roseus]
MSHFYSNNFKLGILGGGQLGRMFIQAAINFDVNVHILEKGSESPASSAAFSYTNGDIQNFEDVYNFGKDKDVLTIEIENVNIPALKKLEQEGVKVYPQPHIIELIQDKGAQKAFYEKHQIPTAPFYLIENRNEISSYITELPFMQKMRVGGYDGKGVLALHDENDIIEGFDAPSVLEKFVDFEKELAVIVARNENGEIKTFPLVEQEFNPEANLVEFLFSPADINDEISKKAIAIAEQIVLKLDFVGILAVELFLTKDNELLVNEIAPRPHNSGHHTIEGNITSQFEQHLRAILNLPLGCTDIKIPSVMINLLGDKGYSGKVKYTGMEAILALPGVTPHIYGKAETKPFRKMGHVTVVNPALNKAKEIAIKVKNTIRVQSES